MCVGSIQRLIPIAAHATLCKQQHGVGSNGTSTSTRTLTNHVRKQRSGRAAAAVVGGSGARACIKRWCAHNSTPTTLQYSHSWGCSGQAGGLLLLRNEKNGGHNLQGTSRAVRCESFDVDPLNMGQAQASAEPHVGPRTLGHTLTTDASYLCQGPRPGTCIFRRAIRGATCAAQHLP